MRVDTQNLLHAEKSDHLILNTFHEPDQVNAAYAPSVNSLWVPAGILRPPFLHADDVAAVRYGSLGQILGHELTHGFDNTGAKYDKGSE